MANRFVARPIGVFKQSQTILSAHATSMHAQAQRVPRLANLNVNVPVRTGKQKRR